MASPNVTSPDALDRDRGLTSVDGADTADPSPIEASRHHSASPDSESSDEVSSGGHSDLDIENVEYVPPWVPALSDARSEGVQRSRCVFGSRHVGPLLNPATGRHLPVARTPVHCFVRQLLSYALSGWAFSITFVGLCQMERYLLGVDPAFDDARVERALRVAIRVMAVDYRDEYLEELDEVEVDQALERVRFMSRDEYRAEVGEEVWEMETGFVPS
jgi:hypothetical protein